MLAPTPRLIVLMGVGIPLTLLLAALVPQLWTLGAAWMVGVIILAGLDIFLAPRPGKAKLSLEAPFSMAVGSKSDITLSLAGGGTYHNGEAAVTTAARLKTTPQRASIISGDQDAGAIVSLEALRRGQGHIKRLWARWTGPLGLVWIQRQDKSTARVAITPDVASVKDTAAQIFSRDALFGQKIQRRRGEGTEFDSLVEFSTGMDPRSIDWKHSARHSTLHAKEFRTERNHNIVFAFDTGHLMSEPAADKSGHALTKIDRAINSALLMGYVSLKMGDRVGFFAFDKKPYLFTKPVAGTQAFGHLQALSSRIDYGTDETNFVLGLSNLSQSLSRRSLIVVFTDFVDTVSAELMVENITRLMRRHLVVFVAFRDVDVENIIMRRPESPEDIARAVVAETLAMERDIVLARLERLGVQVLDVLPDELNMKLLNRFMDIKRRELL